MKLRRRPGPTVATSHLTVLAIGAGTGVALVGAPPIFAGLLATVLGLMGLGLCLRLLAPPEEADAQRLRRWTFASFAVHTVIGLVIAGSPTLTTIFGGDAITYHEGAVGIVQHWSTGAPLPPYIAVGKEGFFYALAAVYYVLGPHKVAGIVLSGALAAALLPVTFDTTRRLFGRRAAHVSVVMLAVLPGFVVWTSQLLRETPILLGLAVAANAGLRLSRRFSAPALVTLAVVCALLFTLRANVALVAAGALLAGMVLGRHDLVAGVGAGAVTVALVALLMVAAGIGYAGYQRSTSADLAEVSLARQDLAGSAESGYARDQDVSTGRAALSFLPVALVNFAFGPFLFQAGNARQLAGVAEALTLWLLFPSLVRGYRRGRRLAGRARLVLTLPAVAVGCSLAILIGNYGTIVRERLQVTIFLVPFAAYGWAQRRGRHTGRAGPDTDGEPLPGRSPLVST